MIAKAGILKGSIGVITALLILLGFLAIIPSDPDATDTVEVPDHAQAERILLDDGTQIGTLYIWSNDLKVLFVKYVLDDEGWEMKRSDLSFGTQLSDIFQRNGDPVPEMFPFTNNHDPKVSDYLYKIDIEGAYTKEDLLYMAAHCIVFNSTEPSQKDVERSGWTGENTFLRTSNARYFIYRFSREEVWPPSGTASFGFEDLPLEVVEGSGLKPNDWDYNDLVFDASIRTSYFENRLMWMEWTFFAEERTASFSHLLNLFIPAEIFKSNGNCEITYFANDSRDIIESTEIPFEMDNDFNIGIFKNGYTNDAVDQKQVTTIKIIFEKGFYFDLSHFGYNELDAHASALFFDPYLYVIGTKEEIHIGDVRMVFVPENWEWPTPDKTPIWEAYPYNFLTGNGVYHDETTNEPIFVGDWYLVKR